MVKMLQISVLAPLSQISFIKNITITRLGENNSIKLRYDRLVILARDLEKFKGIFNSNRKNEFVSAHLGGGMFLSVCNGKYGIRLGYFHMEDGLLTPSGKAIYIYSEEWLHFYNTMCDYARQIRMANVRLCWETKMHCYWVKFWGGCLECTPFNEKSIVFANYE